jgi:aryl-alcohol dehydrogenase-like predicted oxidoreductase
MESDLLAIRPDRRALGRSGLAVFPLAYGCWRWPRIDLRRARACIEAALESGIELFDLADVYGGAGAVEELFGQVLAEAPALRARLVVATKGGLLPGSAWNTSFAYLIRAAEDSLRRLRCERIDLYFVHRCDFLTHPEETARALQHLWEQGKIRAVGVSNYTPAQLDALQRFLPLPIAAQQREWSCVWPAPLQDGTIDHCLREGIGFLAWSPLAGGKLALSLAECERQRNAELLARVVRVLDEVAAPQSVPRVAVALAFLLAHPVAAVPILGTCRPERIRELAAAVFRVQLERRHWYAILQAGWGRTLV